MASSGKKASNRAPTIIDVAELASVSPATVSNVIQGKIRVTEPKRDRVLAAIAELGYQPNAGARYMRQRSKVLGVVVGNLHNPFHAELAALIEEQAAAHQHSILLATTGGLAGREATRVRTLVEHRVAAIVFLAFAGGRTVLDNIPSDMTRIFVSLVGQGGTSISVDDNEGARLAVEHLLDLGHERIAYLSSTMGDELKTDAPRYAGFRRVLESRGVPLDERLVVRRSNQTGDAQSSPDEELQALLTQRRRPTAVFAASDFTALELIQAAEALGLEIPRDLSVVGFDDIAIARLLGLTTVAQPKNELAERAVRLAIDAPPSDGERARRGVRVAPSLIVRRSTAPPQAT